MEGLSVIIPMFQILLIPIAIYGLYVVFVYLKNCTKTNYFLKIQFPTITEEEIGEYVQKMATIFDTLHKSIHSNTKKLSFELYKTEGRIVFFLSSNNKEVIEQAKLAFGQLENIIITQTTDDPLKTFTRKHTKMYTRSIYNTRDFFPINPNTFFINSLTHIFDSLSPHEDANICFVIRGVKKEGLINFKIEWIEKNQKGKDARRLTPQENEKIQMYSQKTSDNLFRIKVYVQSTDKNKLKAITSVFSQLKYKQNNFHSRIALKRNALTRYISPETLLSLIPPIRALQGIYLTTTELASLLHPSSSVRGSHTPNQLKTIAARPEFLEKRDDNMVIGNVTDGEGNEHTVYYPRKNVQRHMYLLGKTGVGKSTILHTVTLDAIRDQKTTLFVIDPDGDLLIDIISNTPEPKRINYFAPRIEMKETDSVISFNPFFNLHEPFTYKNAIRDMMLDIIKRETEENTGNFQTGAMTQSRISESLDILIEFPDEYFAYLQRKKGKTPEEAEKIVRERQVSINDLPLLFDEDKKYYPLLKEVFRPESTIGRYVHNDMEKNIIGSKVNDAVNAAVKSRFDQILHSSLRYTFEGNAISLDTLKDDAQIHLFPVSDAIYGSHGQRIVTQMLFSLLWLNKKRVPEQKRKDTVIIIDEFQNMQVNGLEAVLASARKFRFYLIAANQQLGQLRESVRDALIGNVGTLIAFRLGGGQVGAEYLARELGDQVTEQDLIQLPPYHAYIKTETVDNKGVVRFSFETIPVEKKGTNEELIKNLQEKTLKKYGETISSIEEKIQRKQENPKRYFTDGV